MRIHLTSSKKIISLLDAANTKLASKQTVSGDDSSQNTQTIHAQLKSSIASHFYLLATSDELDGLEDILNHEEQLTQFKQAFKDFESFKVNTGNPYESLVGKLYDAKINELVHLNSNLDDLRDDVYTALDPQAPMFKLLIEEKLFKAMQQPYGSHVDESQNALSIFIQVLKLIIFELVNLYRETDIP